MTDADPNVTDPGNEPPADPNAGGGDNPPPSDSKAGDPPPDEGKKPETIAADAGKDGDDKPAAAPADWPEDWASKLAGDDEKAAKRLSRFSSPKALWDAYRALEAKMSSGELKTALKPDASDEERAAWRAENGIPDDPKGYTAELPDGLVIGDEDKPIVEGFQKAAHDADLTPAQFNAALSWYYKTQDELAAEQGEADATKRAEFEDELRAEWGADYRTELRRVNSLFDMAPEGVDAGQFFAGRLADGTPIGNHAPTLRWLNSLAREINPTATVVPSGGANAMQSIEEEIAAIERDMRTDRTAYFKDEAKQKRYEDLLTARDKQRSRAA